MNLYFISQKNGSTSLTIDGVTCVGSNIAADPIATDKIGAPSMPLAHSLVSNKMQSQDAVNPKFMWSVFFKEFFYHTFFPFSLPVILYFEGEIYSTNHQFTNIYGFIYQSWLSVVVLSSNLFYFLSLSILSSKVPNIELYLANTVFLLHRFMVSSKVWGTMFAIYWNYENQGYYSVVILYKFTTVWLHGTWNVRSSS